MKRIETPLCCRCAGMLRKEKLKITRLRERAADGSVCPWCERAGNYMMFHIEEKRDQ